MKNKINNLIKYIKQLYIVQVIKEIFSLRKNFFKELEEKQNIARDYENFKAPLDDYNHYVNQEIIEDAKDFYEKIYGSLGTFDRNSQKEIDRLRIVLEYFKNKDYSEFTKIDIRNIQREINLLFVENDYFSPVFLESLHELQHNYFKKERRKIINEIMEILNGYYKYDFSKKKDEKSRKFDPEALREYYKKMRKKEMAFFEFWTGEDMQQSLKNENVDDFLLMHSWIFYPLMKILSKYYIFIKKLDDTIMFYIERPKFENFIYPFMKPILPFFKEVIKFIIYFILALPIKMKRYSFFKMFHLLILLFVVILIHLNISKFFFFESFLSSYMSKHMSLIFYQKLHDVLIKIELCHENLWDLNYSLEIEEKKHLSEIFRFFEEPNLHKYYDRFYNIFGKKLKFVFLDYIRIKSYSFPFLIKIIGFFFFLIYFHGFKKMTNLILDYFNINNNFVLILIFFITFLSLIPLIFAFFILYIFLLNDLVFFEKFKNFFNINENNNIFFNYYIYEYQTIKELIYNFKKYKKINQSLLENKFIFTNTFDLTLTEWSGKGSTDFMDLYMRNHIAHSDPMRVSKKIKFQRNLFKFLDFAKPVMFNDFVSFENNGRIYTEKNPFEKYNIYSTFGEKFFTNYVFDPFAIDFGRFNREYHMLKYWNRIDQMFAPNLLKLLPFFNNYILKNFSFFEDSLEFLAKPQEYNLHKLILRIDDIYDLDIYDDTKQKYIQYIFSEHIKKKNNIYTYLEETIFDEYFINKSFFFKSYYIKNNLLPFEVISRRNINPKNFVNLLFRNKNLDKGLLNFKHPIVLPETIITLHGIFDKNNPMALYDSISLRKNGNREAAVECYNYSGFLYTLFTKPLSLSYDFKILGSNNNHNIEFSSSFAQNTLLYFGNFYKEFVFNYYINSINYSKMYTFLLNKIILPSYLEKNENYVINLEKITKIHNFRKIYLNQTYLEKRIELADFKLNKSAYILEIVKQNIKKN